MIPTRHDEPLAALLHELGRVARHHDERAANPQLATALKFFEEDLYGGGDFAQRDADLVRVVPAMKRLMPANVIDTVAVAVELNALSQDLDRSVVDALGS